MVGDLLAPVGSLADGPKMMELSCLFAVFTGICVLWFAFPK